MLHPDERQFRWLPRRRLWRLSLFVCASENGQSGIRMRVGGAVVLDLAAGRPREQREKAH